MHGPLRAQVPVRDTIPRRDTTAKPDTIPKKRDTATVAIPVPLHADSLLRDSLAKKDSILKADSLKKVKGDTVRPPTAHSEIPIELTIGRKLHWDRDSLFATGAITLADLLERIPGFSGLHAGWISAPAIGAYMGDTCRVRVFLDGFEYTSLDQRTQGMLDLTQFNLWAMEDATIEVAADEIRVYMRSWRVYHRASETRTDVSTGDQQTNMYRGFYATRLYNGLAVQFAAQQYGTTPPSESGSSSDQTGVVGRIGWANRMWSIDGFISQISRHRGVITREFINPGDSIPTTNSSRSDSIRC